MGQNASDWVFIYSWIGWLPSKERPWETLYHPLQNSKVFPSSLSYLRKSITLEKCSAFIPPWLSLVLFQIDLPSILINNIQFFIINHNIINVSLHPQFIVQIKSIISSWSFPPINLLNNRNHYFKIHVLYFIKYSKTHLIYANNLPKHFWISISSYLSLHMTAVFVSPICRTLRLISYYNQSLLNNRN